MSTIFHGRIDANASRNRFSFTAHGDLQFRFWIACALIQYAVVFIFVGKDTQRTFEIEKVSS